MDEINKDSKNISSSSSSSSEQIKYIADSMRKVKVNAVLSLDLLKKIDINDINKTEQLNSFCDLIVRNSFLFISIGRLNQYIQDPKEQKILNQEVDASIDLVKKIIRRGLNKRLYVDPAYANLSMIYLAAKRNLSKSIEYLDKIKNPPLKLYTKITNLPHLVELFLYQGKGDEYHEQNQYDEVDQYELSNEHKITIRESTDDILKNIIKLKEPSPYGENSSRESDTAKELLHTSLDHIALISFEALKVIHEVYEVRTTPILQKQSHRKQRAKKIPYSLIQDINDIDELIDEIKDNKLKNKKLDGFDNIIKNTGIYVKESEKLINQIKSKYRRDIIQRQASSSAGSGSNNKK